MVGAAIALGLAGRLLVWTGLDLDGETFVYHVTNDTEQTVFADGCSGDCDTAESFDGKTAELASA